MIYADIELVNTFDLAYARHTLPIQEKLHSVEVKMVVDDGGMYMCIHEEVRQALNLDVVDCRKFKTSDGNTTEFEIVGPLEVRFKNQRCTKTAVVVPKDFKMRLGQMAMSEMGLMVDFDKNELLIIPERRIWRR